MEACSFHGGVPKHACARCSRSDVCSKHPPRKLSGTAEIAVSERSRSSAGKTYESTTQVSRFLPRTCAHNGAQKAPRLCRAPTLEQVGVPKHACARCSRSDGCSKHPPRNLNGTAVLLQCKRSDSSADETYTLLTQVPRFLPGTLALLPRTCAHRAGNPCRAD